MDKLTFLCLLFLSSLGATYFLWFICHLNGQLLFYGLHLCNKKWQPNTSTITSPGLDCFYFRPLGLTTVYLVGAMPIAVLSLSTAYLNHCFNAFYGTVILELVFGLVFLLLPNTQRKAFDLFGFRLIQRHRHLVIYTSIWCLVFSIWVMVTRHSNLDTLVLNTNPDFWAYVRRYGAMTTTNLNFYGMTDSFKFPDNSACAYFLGSPKKFSSFLGAIVSYLFSDLSFGITVFQGMLGATLFMALFKDWCATPLDQNQSLNLSDLALVIWAVSSPQLYWLLVSAYFSNTLFIIVISLVLRQARNASLHENLFNAQNFLCLFCIQVVVFSFYPAFLPITIAVYFCTTLIYLKYSERSPNQLFFDYSKYAILILICGLIFYTLFNSQFILDEIQKSINPLKSHGTNFVPLNPWSLFQEKPKPMGANKDFGVWFNVVLGLLFSVYCLWQLYRAYSRNKDFVIKRDLLAGCTGMGLYSFYLLAYIPLESTYRLGKIAISLIYPLGIFALLPVVVWLKDYFRQQANWQRQAVLGLAIAHVVFHIYKITDATTFPSGQVTMPSPAQQKELSQLNSITIIGCERVHQSQFYERLVGLQVAKQNPHLQVNVVNEPANLTPDIMGDRLVFGQIIPGPTPRYNACKFDF
ncbi:hypothetical protein [Picosynechococcus sp. PCC 73109]|uniref:hypothetical protein n=1 Tax=Picosynechococcus sp. PCC 73109 TaxID=374982 RepID=UPI000A5D2E07|nr:hypothetical protein [Picosynechococcus sp. PCC 73109]